MPQLRILSSLTEAEWLLNGEEIWFEIELLPKKEFKEWIQNFCNGNVYLQLNTMEFGPMVNLRGGKFTGGSSTTALTFSSNHMIINYGAKNIIYFSNKDDAMLFKLQWVETIKENE